MDNGWVGLVKTRQSKCLWEIYSMEVGKLEQCLLGVYGKRNSKRAQKALSIFIPKALSERVGHRRLIQIPEE